MIIKKPFRASDTSNLGIKLDKKILNMLNIDEETFLEITTDGKSIILTPVRENLKNPEIDKLFDVLHNKFRYSFERLYE